MAISQQTVESRCTCATVTRSCTSKPFQGVRAAQPVLNLPLQTYALRECMLKHREYYAPVLEEEVSLHQRVPHSSCGVIV